MKLLTMHSPIISSLLRPNTVLSSLFSNILILYSSLDVRGQVSHPHKTIQNYDCVHFIRHDF
jgi:hypothetical protein